MTDTSENLPPIMYVLHKAMMRFNQAKGHQEPCQGLKYWKEFNESNDSMISPLTFNMAAKRLFRDLGKIENNQAQSMLSGTLEMTELVRSFVQNEVNTLSLSQNSLMHLQAAQFQRLAVRISMVVHKKKSN